MSEIQSSLPKTSFVDENNISQMIGLHVLDLIAHNDDMCDMSVYHEIPYDDLRQSLFHEELKKVYEGNPELKNQLQQSFLKASGIDGDFDLNTENGRKKFKESYGEVGFSTHSQEFKDLIGKLDVKSLTSLYAETIDNNFNKNENGQIISLKDDSPFKNSSGNVFPVAYIDKKGIENYKEDYSNAFKLGESKAIYMDFPSLVTTSPDGKNMVANNDSLNFVNKNNLNDFKILKKPVMVNGTPSNNSNGKTDDKKNKTPEELEEEERLNAINSTPTPFDSLLQFVYQNAQKKQAEEQNKPKPQGKKSLFSFKKKEKLQDQVLLYSIKSLKDSIVEYKKLNMSIEERSDIVENYLKEKMKPTEYQALKDMKESDPIGYADRVSKMQNIISDENVLENANKLSEDMKKRDIAFKTVNEYIMSVADKKELRSDPTMSMMFQQGVSDFGKEVSDNVANAKDIPFKKGNVDLTDNKKQMEEMQKTLKQILESISALFSKVSGFGRK